MTDFSVIICAHNEEGTVGFVLEDVLNQRIPTGHSLREVLVVADGCTDRTADVVRLVAARDPRVRMLTLPLPNRGKALAFNAGIATLHDDVVVMFDADVRIKDEAVTERLILAIGKGAALVSGNDVPVPMQMRTIGDAAGIGRYLIKQGLKRTVKPHPNVYTCVGRALAMHRSFYEECRMPDVPSEDNFRFFSAVERGLRYAYVEDAVVLFVPTRTVADYIRQHARFWRGAEVVGDRFGATAHYGSTVTQLGVVAAAAARHPVIMAGWAIPALAGQIVYWWQRYISRTPPTGAWEPLSSTK